RNVCIDFSKNRQIHSLNDSADEPDPHILSHKLEAKNIVEKLLLELSNEERSLLWDRFVYNNDYLEIAQTRELSIENARQKVSRLIRKIRKMPLAKPEN